MSRISAPGHQDTPAQAAGSAVFPAELLHLGGFRAAGRAGVRRERAPWQESAACRDADTELFFPIGSAGQAVAEMRQAVALCAGCPVRRPCLTYALVTGQEFGIWGGYDENERRLLRTRWRQSRAAAPADPYPDSGPHDAPARHQPYR